MKGKRGAFVVLEGLDGAGTTTQVAAIAAQLRREGQEVVTTREPSNGPVGTMVRQALTGRLQLPQGQGPLTPATLALLFAADRADHVAAEIVPALNRGAVVLSDRYLLSSLAYQGSQLPMSWVAEINRHAVAPALTLFLEVDVTVAARRRAARGDAEELFEADAFQKKTARQYRVAIALRRKAGDRIESIDGGLPVSDITALALAHIRTLKLK